MPGEKEGEVKVTVETLEENDKEAADTEKEAVNDENGGDAFFMTQVMHHAHLTRNTGLPLQTTEFKTKADLCCCLYL